MVANRPGTNALNIAISVMDKRSNSIAGALQNLNKTDELKNQLEGLQDNAQEQSTLRSFSLNVDKGMKLNKARLALVDFFIHSVKDGKLTDKEKKKIMKLLKEYKALKNFLNFSQVANSSRQGRNNNFLGNNSFSSMQTPLPVNNSSYFQSSMRKTFNIIYSQIENDISEQMNLSAADNKVSTKERSQNLKAKAELDEIKSLGEIILKAL